MSCCYARRTFDLITHSKVYFSLIATPFQSGTSRPWSWRWRMQFIPCAPVRPSVPWRRTKRGLRVYSPSSNGCPATVSPGICCPTSSPGWPSVSCTCHKVRYNKRLHPAFYIVRHPQGMLCDPKKKKKKKRWREMIEQSWEQGRGKMRGKKKKTKRELILQDTTDWT